MKKIFYLILPLLFSFSSAFAINPIIKISKLASSAPNPTAKKKLKNKLTDLEGHLVAHTQFVFVEYIENNVSLDSTNEITEEFDNATYRFRAYTLTDAKLAAKHRNLLGNDLILNNYDRSTYEAKIQRLIVIHDEMNQKPYLAAELENRDFDNIYYAWVTKQASDPYLFEEKVVDEIALSNLRDFAITVGGMKGYADNVDGYQVQDEFTEIKQYSAVKGTTYIVIQEAAIAECASILSSQIKVYKMTSLTAGILIASGETRHYFIDLVDTNGDKVPEVLVGDFSSAELLQMEGKALKPIQNLSWSVTVCPC